MRSGVMRMLVVSPFYAPAWEQGGVVRATYDWTVAVASLGVQAQVVTTAGPGTGIDDGSFDAGRNMVRVVYCPRARWGGNLFLSTALARQCYRLIPECDVVHSVGLWNFPSVVGSIIASRFRIPYIVSLHGMLMPAALAQHRFRKSFMIRAVERRRLANSSAVVCCSQVEKHEYDKLKIRDNATVVGNVVELNGPPPDRGRFRSHNNLEKNFIMLFAGRLVHMKGLDFTIRAFSRVVEHYPKARLVIVGPTEGGCAFALTKLVQSLRLDSRVRFEGMLSGQAYREAVASADLFVLNSRSENFGLVVGEALGLGVPVLISDQVGLADLVESHQAGIVTPLAVDEIHSAMCRVLAGELDLATMGRRGQELVRSRFSSAAVGGRFFELLRGVVAGNARGQTAGICEHAS